MMHRCTLFHTALAFIVLTIFTFTCAADEDTWSLLRRGRRTTKIHSENNIPTLVRDVEVEASIFWHRELSSYSSSVFYTDTEAPEEMEAKSSWPECMTDELL